MTPEEWNEAKLALPVGPRATEMDPAEAALLAAKWIVEWWRPVALHIDRCMAEHDRLIFPSSKWSSAEAHLRDNDRNPGEVVAQLPIVCNLAEVEILLAAMERIRDALIKHNRETP